MQQFCRVRRGLNHTYGFMKKRNDVIHQEQEERKMRTKYPCRSLAGEEALSC